MKAVDARHRPHLAATVDMQGRLQAAASARCGICRAHPRTKNRRAVVLACTAMMNPPTGTQAHEPYRPAGEIARTESWGSNRVRKFTRTLLRRAVATFSEARHKCVKTL